MFLLIHREIGLDYVQVHVVYWSNIISTVSRSPGMKVHGPTSCNHTQWHANQWNSIYSTLGSHIFCSCFSMENQEAGWWTIWNLMERPTWPTEHVIPSSKMQQSPWLDISTVRSVCHWSKVTERFIWSTRGRARNIDRLSMRIAFDVSLAAKTDHFTEEQRTFIGLFWVSSGQTKSNTFQPLATQRNWDNNVFWKAEFSQTPNKLWVMHYHLSINLLALPTNQYLCHIKKILHKNV